VRKAVARGGQLSSSGPGSPSSAVCCSAVTSHIGIAVITNAASVPADEPCADGVCDGKGECRMVCDRADDDVCDDDNPCTADTCDVSAARCDNEPLNGDTTPPLLQTDGDCLTVQCEGGSLATLVDVADLPTVAALCMVGTCDASGTPGTAPMADDTPCDDGDLCIVGQACQGGACVGGADPCAVACDDTNCSDACNPATGACDANQPAGTSCAQLALCNDSCDGGGNCT